MTELPDIALDQQLAGKVSAQRLATEFNGVGLADVRPVRDEVERRVLALLAELHVTPVNV